MRAVGDEHHQPGRRPRDGEESVQRESGKDAGDGCEEPCAILPVCTEEHLGKSDIGIITYRRMLRRAIDAAQNGGDMPMTLSNGDGANIRGPAAVDTIAELEGWEEAWKARDMERREKSGWAPDPW